MSTIVKNFESLVIILLYSGSLLFFHQAPQVEKESGVEGKKLEILKNHLGQFYKFINFLSYGLKITLYNFISIITFISYITVFIRYTLLF